MSTTVARDPYSRTELRRRTLTRGECAWCGSRAPENRRRLYTYEVESDGGRAFGESAPFCGLDCYGSFNS